MFKLSTAPAKTIGSRKGTSNKKVSNRAPFAAIYASIANEWTSVSKGASVGVSNSYTCGQFESLDLSREP
jgi:hypothetical protein